jgi:quercetin dioxygenase-like cupin family protein
MSFIDYKRKNLVKIWDGIYGQMHYSQHLTCAHITIQKGAVLPEHFHEQEQWSHMLDGEMEFTVGGETQLLRAGQTAYIPSNVPHSAKTLTECKLIDVFSPPREDWGKLEQEQFPVS